MNEITKTELINSTSKQNDLLMYAIQEGIIDFDSVHNDYMASKKEQILKNHKYAITPPTETNQRWQTYYKGADGKRKLLRASTKDKLVEKLIPIYFSDVLIDKMTFEDLFKEWLEYKKEISNSPNTPMRHTQRYEKYIKPSILNNMGIRTISELLLERESNRIVREFNLSAKEWCNTKTIINGMYKYAVRKGYLTENPMEHVEITVRFRQVLKKTGKTQTYNTEELADLNRYLDRMYEQTHDSSFMAVKINFLLGLRVGELVALKWEDVCDEKHVHIIREEVRDQRNGHLEVVDHTKTHTDRFVILVPKAIAILESIEHQGEYIFMRDGERLTARQINYVLEKYGERTNNITKRDIISIDFCH